MGAINSPHRNPVLMAVSTINRCCTGSEARMATYSLGVSVRAFFLTTLGSSVWAQGLKVTTWSRWARSKTECEHGVVLPNRRGGEAVRGGGGDPALDLGGEDPAHRVPPAVTQRRPRRCGILEK